MPFLLGDCDCCDDCCGPCQQYSKCDDCCWCLPKAICVSVSNVEEGCSCEGGAAVFQATGGGVCGDPVTYAGNVECGGLTIDLSFSIEHDSGCKIFLESSCMGLTGVNRASQSLGIAEPPVGECSSELAVEFNVSGAANCGDENCNNLTISVNAVDTMDNPVDCDGCQCLCRCVCITYAKDLCDSAEDLCEDRVQSCWNESSQSWQATLTCNGNEIDIEAFLEENANGDCVIRFASSVLPEQSPLALGASCDDFGIDVTWEWEGDGGCTESVKIACLICDDCVVREGTCCGSDPEGFPNNSRGPMPQTLYLTISRGVDPSNDCPCAEGDVVVPLVWNGNLWEGTGEFCSTSQVDSTATFELQCNLSGSWDFGWKNNCGCTDGDGWDSSVSGFSCRKEGLVQGTDVLCDPFEIELGSVSISIDCCEDPGTSAVEGVVELSIME